MDTDLIKTITMILRDINVRGYNKGREDYIKQHNTPSDTADWEKEAKRIIAFIQIAD